jgi:asparagine synthase (glutamine-hydrolysing)
VYSPYVALFWNAQDPAQAIYASDLIQTLRNAAQPLACRSIGKGRAIFDGPSPRRIALTYVLANGQGVIYGRLFSRDSARPLAVDAVARDETFAQSCVDTRGDHLVKNYWGSYVAIIIDQRSTRFTVIRDCSGQVPCYYTSIGDLTAVFSDVRCIESVLPPPSLNWKYLAAFLAAPHLEIRDTGVLGMSELLAGEGIYFSEGRIANKFAWDPTVVCTEDPILDTTLASRSLRETTSLCISAWAPGFRRILHSLSGGFDSSLVLQLLAKAAPRPEMICVNWYSNGPQEDERAYARVAAANCEAELLEVPMDIGAPKFDECCLALPRTPKPSVLNLIESADAPAWNEICSRQAVEAIWTGQGGDHIFMAGTSVLGLGDCLQLFGFGKELAAAARDAVTLTRRSLWHVILREALFALNTRRFLDVATLTPDVTRLCRGAVPDRLHEYTLHPWYLSSEALPAGKRYQLLILSDVLNRHRPMPDVRSTEDFHPLLSQPIIETCLRIPLSLLLVDGRTRGLARKAFADILPQKIARREQKGEAGSYIVGIFRRSSQFIADLLLDGLLVRDGLLSRNSVITLLHPDFAVSADQFNPLFACTAAELWARAWRHPEHTR